MICLTLEDDTVISVRPSDIRTVQELPNGWALVTLNDLEMYTVRQSREQVTKMMETQRGRRRRGH